MVPALAKLVHSAKTTLHDNTYKRVFGKFNEWEVVIWESRLNQRLTVARAYCNRETRQAFRLMWRGWFEAVKKTTGQPLYLKRLHQKGQHIAFLLDGCAAQIQGLGDILLSMNNAEISGINTEHVDEIVQYFIRTCNVHFNRNVDLLSSVCTFEELDRIQRCRFIAKEEDLNIFIQWCSEHSQQRVRDWIQNKIIYRWYLPSLCRRFSKIALDDWDLTQGDTNLNESSHTATNRVTGINLPLLEAIESTRTLDTRCAEGIAKTETSCILPRHRNTVMNRHVLNGNRTNARAQRADKEYEVVHKLSDIDAQMSAVQNERKEAAEALRVLKEKKKLISGGKKRKLRFSSRKKGMPAFNVSTLVPVLHIRITDHRPPKLDADLEPPPSTPYAPLPKPSFDLYLPGPPSTLQTVSSIPFHNHSVQHTMVVPHLFPSPYPPLPLTFPTSYPMPLQDWPHPPSTSYNQNMFYGL